MRHAASEVHKIIDRIDFNATTHGQRDIDDDRLSKLIEKIAEKPLGLKDVEPDIIGRSYEYLIRKFAEGSGQSAGEFYTPAEVGVIMAKIMDAEPGMEVYDPCCGSGGLLIKCELERFPAGSCGGKIALTFTNGKAAVVLDTGAASRGSGNQGNNKEKEVRKWFIEQDLIEGVIYLPENLFYTA